MRISNADGFNKKKVHILVVEIDNLDDEVTLLRSLLSYQILRLQNSLLRIFAIVEEAVWQGNKLSPRFKTIALVLQVFCRMKCLRLL